MEAAFHTVTTSDLNRSINWARNQPNAVTAQIRAALVGTKGNNTMRNDLRPAHFNDVLPKIDGHRAIVLDALKITGPVTAKELAAAMAWDVTSVRPRLTELRQIGAVVTTGERRNCEHVLEVAA